MLDIHIDRESDRPLYAQIRDALKAAIEDGVLKPGEQLPTVMALANQVGVTQSTIRRALEDLIKRGTVSSQVGRGTFVSEEEPPPAPQPQSAQGRRLKQPDPEFRAAARRMRSGITKSLETLLSLSQRSGLIDFTSGIPGPDSDQDGLIHEVMGEALTKARESYLYNCNEPWGIQPLREAIAERYCQAGLEVQPEQVLVTNGAQQALALIALYTREHKRRFICETPCFTGIPKAFGTLGHWVEHVPRDEEGPEPERLLRFADGEPSTFYMCPMVQNPMGTDISPQRLQTVVDWAQNQDALVISDELFNDLRFKQPGPQSILAALGPQQCVITSSISKSFLASLRIGWLITNPKLVQELAKLKRSLDLGCPPIMQGAVLSLFKSGAYDEHLARVREIYRQRREVFLEALERRMPKGVTWTKPVGGFTLWLTLPRGYSSIVLYMMAIDQGVSFIPGPYQDIDHRFVNCCRISYAQAGPEQIREGVELLAFAIKQLMQSPPGDAGLSGLGDFV
jgi:2-aminoadipate transaminase